MDEDFARSKVEKQLARDAKAPGSAVRLTWCQVDGRSWWSVSGVDADGSPTRVRTPLLLDAALRHLRAATADPVRGAWRSADVEVRADGTSTWRYNHTDRVHLACAPGDPLTPAPGPAEPHVDAFRRDLVAFPRAETPAWAAVDEPAPALTGLEAALARDLPAPPDLDPVTWRDLRAGVATVLRDADRHGGIDWNHDAHALADQLGELCQFAELPVGADERDANDHVLDLFRLHGA